MSTLGTPRPGDAEEKYGMSVPGGIPYTVKDSGKRAAFASGMVRDTDDGKVDYTLVRDGPMYERWAAHLTQGAKKYAKRNWMKAAGEAELQRFKESLLRHLEAYLRGEADEDHAAAMIFNLNGMEYVKEKLCQGYKQSSTSS